MVEKSEVWVRGEFPRKRNAQIKRWLKNEEQQRRILGGAMEIGGGSNTLTVGREDEEARAGVRNLRVTARARPTYKGMDATAPEVGRNASHIVVI